MIRLNEYTILDLARTFAAKAQPLYEAGRHSIVQATTPSGIPSVEDLEAFADSMLRKYLERYESTLNDVTDWCGGVHVDVRNYGPGPYVSIGYYAHTGWSCLDQ